MEAEQEWYVVGRAWKGSNYKYWLEGSWIQPKPAWADGPATKDIPTLLTLEAATRVADSVGGMVYSWDSIRERFGVG